MYRVRGERRVVVVVVVVIIVVSGDGVFVCVCVCVESKVRAADMTVVPAW